MKLFDKSKPAVAVQRAPMGGGWAWGLTEDGKLALEHYFGEAAEFIAPLGHKAHIVEPADSGDIAEYLLAEGLAWEVQ